MVFSPILILFKYLFRKDKNKFHKVFCFKLSYKMIEYITSVSYCDIFLTFTKYKSWLNQKNYYKYIFL